MSKQVEYRVRPVGRYVVTRHTSDENSGSLETLGEFQRQATAEEVASALAGQPVYAVVLPAQDIPAQLRNIASSFEAGEFAYEAGMLVLCRGKKTAVFGLGATVEDPFGMLEAGRKELKRTI